MQQLFSHLGFFVLVTVTYRIRHWFGIKCWCTWHGLQQSNECSMSVLRCHIELVSLELEIFEARPKQKVSNKHQNVKLSMWIAALSICVSLFQGCPKEWCYVWMILFHHEIFSSLKIFSLHWEHFSWELFHLEGASGYHWSNLFIERRLQ